MTSMMEQTRSMSWRDGGLLGVQEPTHRLCLPEASNAAVETIQFAESFGLVLDPWQRLSLETALGETAGGLWSSFEFGLECPRQNGKGGTLEARELAGLFLFGDRLILHSAHEFKTCEEAFRRVMFWVDNCDWLRKRVKRVTTANGKESIELLNGNRLRFVARSKGSGRGFTGDLIVLDEAMILDPHATAAMIPTVSARPNAQIWYTGSAPFATSDVWHKVRRRALDAIKNGDDSGRLSWCGWANDATIDTQDEAAVARVNPGLGFRLSWRSIEAERDAMDEPDFRRERLGVPDMPVFAGSVFTDGRWLECWDPDSQVDGDRVAVGVDMDPDRKNTSVAVAGVRSDQLGHIEVVERRPGSDWVLSYLQQLLGSVDAVGPVQMDKGSPIASIVPDLTDAGIDVDELDTRTICRASGVLYDAVETNEIRHIGQTVLDDAVTGAVPKFSGDTWRWARRGGQGDVSPLMAATVALWGLDNAQDHDVTGDIH